MKTVNRRTFTVDAPGSDVKDYFFNHYNWKGMSDDKNFLTADQETFESCDNVYMDSEGLLRSRPAVKPSYICREWNSIIPNIVKTWSFVDVLISCVVKDEFADKKEYSLWFCDKSGKVFKEETGFISENIKPILKDGKIFIFSDTPGKFLYFDTSSKTLNPALQYVYVPEIKVEENFENVESINNLTFSKTETYLYSSLLKIPNELKGKNVQALIDDLEYELVFNDITSPLILFEKFSTLPYNTTNLLVSNALGSNLFVTYSTITGALYTSTDGETWTYRDSFTNAPSDIDFGISRDGTLFYIVNGIRLYFISLTKTESDYKYYSFTEVMSLADLYNDDVYLGNASRTRAEVVSDSLYVFMANIAKYNEDFSDFTFNNSHIRIVDNDVKTDYNFDKYILAIDAQYNPANKDKFDIAFLAGNLYSNSTGEFSEIILNGIDKYYEFGDAAAISIRENIVAIANRYRNEVYNFKGEQLFKKSVDSPGWTVQILEGGNVAFSDGIYSIVNDEYIDYLNRLPHQKVKVHKSEQYLYYSLDDSSIVYRNYVTTPVPLKITESEGSLNQSFIDVLSASLWSELDTFYVGKNQILYISEPRYNNNGEFLWYFPKITEQRFNHNITGLQPISNTDMAIFFENEIWYSTKSEGIYYYNKSKLKVGLKAGGDVISSYDGTSVLFASQRGLVSLSYQDFVASTDQALTFLSDAIHEQFINYCKNPVKLCRHQYWYICYNDDKVYFLDTRTNGWWPMTFSKSIKQFVNFNDDLLLLTDKKLHSFSYSDVNYSDYNDMPYGENIDWHIKSQKLHLNAVNYYKHIANLTLLSVLDSDKEMSFMMEVNNYRKKMNKAEIQTVEFRVDAIRTFVKRVSYPKVNEFQYVIHQDDEQAIRLPLSLSGITIKYRVGGQVR